MTNIFLAAAIALVMNVHSQTQDACLKLRPPSRSFAIDLGLVRHDIVWNGSKVSQGEFDRYLRQTMTEHSGAIFLVHWHHASGKIVREITDEIRQRGFDVAMNCPSVPL